MNYNKLLLLIAGTICAFYSNAQHLAKDLKIIEEAEKSKKKVLHAEPLYIDLIRDLGARKGEKEWNIGMGLTDNLAFDSYEALIEYEWAPINNLGLEVELPFTFYTRGKENAESIRPPSNRLNSIKVAAQWTFLVDKPKALSLALGYINEFELSAFNRFGEPVITGNVYNPFIVAAKRWGTNFHTLLYTGPRIEQHFKTQEFHHAYEVNTNFHYMISGTRNFIGIEFNKVINNQDFDMTIRPQMRVSVADNLLIGIVTGIPVSRENERFSSFLRLIWEPKHKH